MKHTDDTQPCALDSVSYHAVEVEAQRLLIERLARLTPIEYDREKKSAAAELGATSERSTLK